MERLSTTENSSDLSTKKPLDVASTKGNKKITNNIVPIRILSLFPQKSNQPTSTQDLVEAAFGFLALLAVIAFVGIITLLRGLNTFMESKVLDQGLTADGYVFTRSIHVRI